MYLYLNLLKANKYIFVRTLLFNPCISLRHPSFQMTSQNAEIVPAHEKCDNHLSVGYGPISYFFFKFLKWLYVQVVKHLSKNDILFKQIFIQRKPVA